MFTQDQELMLAQLTLGHFAANNFVNRKNCAAADIDEQ
jgi:hypothetical protein